MRDPAGLTARFAHVHQPGYILLSEVPTLYYLHVTRADKASSEPIV